MAKSSLGTQFLSLESKQHCRFHVTSSRDVLAFKRHTQNKKKKIEKDTHTYMQTHPHEREREREKGGGHTACTLYNSFFHLIYLGECFISVHIQPSRSFK